MEPAEDPQPGWFGLWLALFVIVLLVGPMLLISCDLLKPRI